MARSNHSQQLNGAPQQSLSRNEERAVEFFLVALGAALGGGLGSIAGVKGSLIGGTIGVASALALIFTQD